MRDASLPVTLIIVGSAWLLWYYRLFPDIDWIIAVGLVVGGMAVLYLDGITKKSIVAGTVLLRSMSDGVSIVRADSTSDSVAGFQVSEIRNSLNKV